jgi:hypothetical protein
VVKDQFVSSLGGATAFFSGVSKERGNTKQKRKKTYA